MRWQLGNHNKGLVWQEFGNRWISMMNRCYDPKRHSYPRYGGRGIQVCSEWHDMYVFAEWCRNNGYKKELQLDRIDNDGNYCPENCRFVTSKENSRNRRNTVSVLVNGQEHEISEAAQKFGVSQYTIYYWINKKGKGYAEQRLANIA